MNACMQFLCNHSVHARAVHLPKRERKRTMAVARLKMGNMLHQESCVQVGKENRIGIHSAKNRQNVCGCPVLSLCVFCS